MMSLAAASPAELADAATVGEATAIKIIAAARDTLDIGFDTADSHQPSCRDRKCTPQRPVLAHRGSWCSSGLQHGWLVGAEHIVSGGGCAVGDADRQ